MKTQHRAHGSLEKVDRLLNGNGSHKSIKNKLDGSPNYMSRIQQKRCDCFKQPGFDFLHRGLRIKNISLLAEDGSLVCYLHYFELGLLRTVKFIKRIYWSCCERAKSHQHRLCTFLMENHLVNSPNIHKQSQSQMGK